MKSSKTCKVANKTTIKCHKQKKQKKMHGKQIESLLRPKMFFKPDNLKCYFTKNNTICIYSNNNNNENDTT